LHHNDYGSIHMGAGTMRKTAPTGKISWVHRHFPRIYAPVTKIHRPSSTLIFMLNIETKFKSI
jgi:hypothetical protein